MTEADLERLGGRGKCNPPFRGPEEVERMWAALLDNKIQSSPLDHAPWPLARKTDADIFACGAGLIGLQSFAPLMLTLLDERGLSPMLMARLCAARPARLHGIDDRKGALRPGLDCDLVVLERGDCTFDKAAIVDRPELRWSPYHGRRMRARVVATVLRGQLIWDGQTVLGRPGGGMFCAAQSGDRATASARGVAFARRRANPRGAAGTAAGAAGPAVLLARFRVAAGVWEAPPCRCIMPTCRLPA